MISINYKDIKSLLRNKLSEFVNVMRIYSNLSIEIHAVFHAVVVTSILISDWYVTTVSLHFNLCNTWL